MGSSSTEVSILSWGFSGQWTHTVDPGPGLRHSPAETGCVTRDAGPARSRRRMHRDRRRAPRRSPLSLKFRRSLMAVPPGHGWDVTPARMIIPVSLVMFRSLLLSLGHGC
eukprot:766945-Hanusia_phi.AAC.3